ncbi:MAG: adenylyl-sulfate kinase [Desulfobacterales bacterium]|nr:adenylyl-sulfate kinase [Desulfobacterales bacterium]
MNSKNTVCHNGNVNRSLRERLARQKSAVFWFTGLSGSGKSTIAHAVEERLYKAGYLTYVFDGDNVRRGLCGDLNFSPEDRSENLRRIGEMVKLFLDAGIVCLTAFISPTRKNRRRIRSLIGETDFYEIYVRCPVEVCEERDVKGLYKKARQGLIKNYTGISSPYEEPENADLVLKTNENTLEDCVRIVLDFILPKISK